MGGGGAEGGGADGPGVGSEMSSSSLKLLRKTVIQ